jgi:hypothetical protein
VAVSFQGTQLRAKEYLSAQTPWRVLILTLIVFFFTVLIYFGMLLGYKPYLKSKTRSLEQKLSVLSQSMDENQQKQIISFFSQMTNIQKLLSDHKIYSPVFDFIEKNTYQQATYLDLKFNIAEMEMKIEGTVPNYEYLIKEIALYNQAPEVKTVHLDNSSVQEASNMVRFSVKLILDRQFFKQIPATVEPAIPVESTSTPEQIQR